MAQVTNIYFSDVEGYESEARITIKNINRSDMMKILNFLDEIEGNDTVMTRRVTVTGSIEMPEEKENLPKSTKKESPAYVTNTEERKNRMDEAKRLVRKGMTVEQAAEKVWKKPSRKLGNTVKILKKQIGSEKAETFVEKAFNDTFKEDNAEQFQTAETVEYVDVENSIEGEGKTVIQICGDVFGPGSYTAGCKEYNKIYWMLKRMHGEGKVRTEKEHEDGRKVTTWHRIREGETVKDEDGTPGGKKKEEMERCMGQFIEFLKPYEGRKEGFGTDELRMATDSPEWAKEELISRLNQRHEGLTERLRENGLGISTYRGESGEKRFIVESA